MALDDVWYADIYQSVNGNPVQSMVSYVETTASTNPAVTQFSIADAIVSDFLVPLKALLSNDWTGLAIQVRKATSPFTNPYTLVLSGAYETLGAVASDAVPSNAPLVVTKYSTLASKRGRGRIYQSGIPESSQDSGQINAASYLDLQDAFAGLMTEVEETSGGAGRWNFCVVSRVLFPVLVFSQVVSVVVRGNLANQRNRRSPPGTA